MHTCMHTYIEARGRWQVSFSSTLYLDFETGSITEPGVHKIGETDWPMSPQNQLSPLPPPQAQNWVIGPYHCAQLLRSSGGMDLPG